MGFVDLSFPSRPGTPSPTGPLASLGKLPLFQELDGEAVARLAASALDMRLPQGSILFRQGEAGAGVYLIIRGRVKLSLQTAGGDDKVIELLGPAESFGEVPVLLGERHMLTAETIEESTLVHLQKDAVLGELERNGAFCARMLREVCRRLQQRTRDFENCMLLSGAQRVAAFLLGQIPEGINGKCIAVTLPAKKGIIASRLNLTHEHFSRILHEIQASGLIEVRGREIRMIDVARLRGYPG
jgi:CRP-like cAMP-binding protein